MKDEELLKEMGKRIVQLRNKAGLSQDDLASIANVTPQLLSTAERGTKAIRPENLLKISCALGVSADFILRGQVVDRDISLLAEKIEKVAPKYLPLIENLVDNCIALEKAENN